MKNEGRKTTHHPIEKVGRIGMVARWRPVHLGHAPVLRALCDHSDQALIGIGSSNTYDLRNPFTLEETKEMIELVLAGRDNYELIPVPDLGDGPRWREMVMELFGPLDIFVTDNPYVTSLLENDYKVIKPVKLVKDEDKIALNGTMVRKKIAQGEGWQGMVPTEVAEYIEAKKLDQRFRKEFGLETLALDTIERRNNVLMG